MVSKGFSRRRWLTLALTVGALVGAATAFAAWTAGGSGSATATAASASTLSITGNSASSLFPTGSSDLALTISNPNPYAVAVSTISSGGSVTVDAAHAGCNVSSVSFNAASGTGLSVVVPAASGSAGTTTVTLTNAVSMSNAAVNACQGATFTVPLSLTGSSS